MEDNQEQMTLDIKELESKDKCLEILFGLFERRV